MKHFRRNIWRVAACLLASGTAGAQDSWVEALAANVNKEVVWLSDVMGVVAGMLRSANASPDDPAFERLVAEHQAKALDQLIDSRLIVNHLRALGGAIPASVADDRIKEIIVERFGGSRRNFLQALRQESMTEDDLRRQIGESFALQQMQTRFVRKRAFVSPQSVEKYFAEHRTELAGGGRVRLRMLTVGRQGHLPGDEMAFAHDLHRKLSAGTDFAEAARLYSEDEFAQNGGDCGWVSFDDLSMDLAETVRDLEPGSLSPVLDTPRGPVILRLEEREAPREAVLDAEMYQRIRWVLLKQATEARHQQWAAMLRRHAFVKVFPAEGSP